MKRVSKQLEYQVADSIVELTITIGNAQMGASRVMLGGKVLATGAVTEEKIGRGSDLFGKELAVKTVVADVNDSTNLTNVKYLLTGGKANQEFNFEETVDQHGDAVIYRVEFNFKR